MLRITRAVVVVVLLFFASFFLVQPSQAQVDEQVTQFSSDITINQDTSLSIVETIVYETTLTKHGIYRYIPVVYRQDGQRVRRQIDRVQVTDDQGSPIPFEQTRDGKNVTLKIGDPDTTFIDSKTYVVSYDVDKAVKRFDSHDELYWDITGEGWQFPIAQSAARISSPFAPIDKIACFSGQIGSDDGLCQGQLVSEQVAVFTYDQPIAYGDNLTVMLGLNQENSLLFPSSTDNALDWLQQNWSLLLLPLPFLILFTWWWKKGRDWQFVSPNVFNLDPAQPQQKKPLQFKAREPYVYEPLKDLTPGEAGALLDEKVDTQDIVAEILELARKKYLQIEQIKVKQLFGSSTDYQFTKLTGAKLPMSEAQEYLLTHLFATKDVITTKELKGTFYVTMRTVREKMEKSLVHKKVYTSQPAKIVPMGITSSIVLLIGVGIVLLAQYADQAIFWPFLVLTLQIPLCLLLAKDLPQKTAVGTNLWLQARGLRKSIKYGKWREEVKEKNLFIEEVLPFAVALGVVDQLSKDMEKLDIQPPEYFQSTTLQAFTASQFVSSFSSQVSSNMSYNPSSSSSSGGSGFSGGSSGGGGGGGGGGSW